MDCASKPIDRGDVDGGGDWTSGSYCYSRWARDCKVWRTGRQRGRVDVNAYREDNYYDESYAIESAPLLTFSRSYDDLLLVM